VQRVFRCSSECSARARRFLIFSGSSLYHKRVTSEDATLALAECHPGSSSQTQTSKQVSPLPASLMSHEPVDTVNTPCEAKWSLYLPLGHQSKRPHSCHLSRNKITVPITAEVLRFSQAQEISLGGQLDTTMVELHTDTRGWRHSSPHQSVLQYNQ